MKLYLDTSSWQLSPAPGGSNTTVIIPAKHGTDLVLEIFPSSPLAPGTLGTLVAKPKDEYTAASVSWDLAWDSPVTSQSGYIFRLPLTTAPLAALFTSGVKSLQLMAEITISSGGSVSKTQTIAISVAREVSGGEEGTPTALPDLKASQAEAEAGTNNSKWMTPLRTFQAIASWVSENLSLSWSAIEEKPSTFPPAAHSHDLETITGLEAALAGKQEALYPLGSSAFSSGGQYPTSYTIKDSSDVVIGVIAITYNGSNKITSVIAYDANETPISKGSWTISYDSNGNLISAICTN